ncbi:hypothetical protein D3C80_887190 [compost metagenome]
MLSIVPVFIFGYFFLRIGDDPIEEIGAFIQQLIEHDCQFIFDFIDIHFYLVGRIEVEFVCESTDNFLRKTINCTDGKMTIIV